jgi:hypothetical protein
VRLSETPISGINTRRYHDDCQTRLTAITFALLLFAAACSDDDGSSSAAETTGATESSEVTDSTHETVDDDRPGVKYSDEGRTMNAPVASIEVDGDASEWSDIEGLDMTLYPISGEPPDTREATLKVAHDGGRVCALSGRR